MQTSTIDEDLEDAIATARRSPSNSVGSRYHTFRIRIADTDHDGHEALCGLIDEGWHLQASPVVINAREKNPRHVVLSMLFSEPIPMRIEGGIRLDGHANIEGRIEGEIRTRQQPSI